MDDPLQFTITIENHSALALYDPGATMNFVNRNWLKKSRLTTKQVPPRRLTNVDGSENKEPQITEELQGKTKIGSHSSKEKYAVANIGRFDVIIGRHFIRRHKPIVEWNENEPDRLVFSSKYCSEQCLPFPIHILGESPDQTRRSDIAYLDQLPGKILTEICHQWLEANATQSHSAAIAEKHKKEEKKPEEILPNELHEFLDVFTEEESATLPPHRGDLDCAIDLEEGKKPPFQRIYKMSPDELAVLKKQLDEDLARKWIKPSKSPARAPVMFVKKKDGSLRLCINYRKMNDVTIKDRLTLPLPDEIFNVAGDAMYWTALDISKAYNNLRVKEGHQWKTAFGTKYGHYEYEVMPFGLTNAPAQFQRFMNETFKDMIDDGVVIYLDDILIYAKTREELLERTKEVLRRCRREGLKCKAKKCEFEKTEIKYLGYVIGRGGIRMDEDKVAAIVEWPEPKNVKQLQAVLGFWNFYRRFIENYSKLCKPFHDLLKKEVKWEWTNVHQEAFDEMKKRFTEAPVLIKPNFDKPYTVECDASNFARGAILSQEGPDGKLHPIAFSSKALTDAERNYDIYDKELLAIFKAFKEWRHFLQGAKGTTIVFTDHQNLETYATTKIPNGRQKRWSQYLEHFDYKIHYRPGKFARPDALSRRPDHEPKEGAEDKKPGIIPKEKFGGPLDVLALTATDVEIQELIEEKSKDDPKIMELRGKLNDKQRMVNHTLIHEERVYVPDNEEIKLKIMQSRHDSLLAGHPGRARTIELVSRDYYWPGMAKYINHYVETCDICQRTKPRKGLPEGTLQPLPAPKGPWTDVTFDLITQLPRTKKGHNAIMTYVDRQSKRAHFLPTKTTINAEGVSDLFIDHIWKLHGLPERVTTDQGPQFNSKWARHNYRRLGIEPTFSTAFHPQTDGQSERANQIVEQFLRIYCSYRQDDWDNYLSMAEFAYNNTKHASTGMTPFFADLGRHPAYLPKRFNSQKEEIPASEEYLQRRKAIEQEIQASIRLAGQEHKRYYDKNVKRKTIYRPGDKVWLSRKDNITGKEAITTQRPSPKLEHRRFGPFKIIEAVGRKAYRIQLPNSMKIHPVFHISRLSPHKPNNIPNRETPIPPPVITTEGEEYEVEEILDSKWMRKTLKYLVKWKGYGLEENTWEPQSNLNNAQELVQEFHKRHPKAANPAHPPSRA